MNKNDLKLILIIVILIIISFILYFILKDKSGYAYVYYENDLIEVIDLSIDNTYTVSGYNGEVVIEVKDEMIRVIKETSPSNLCSKQGFIKNNNESLICLPNKIIITIGEDVDTMIR